MSSPNETDDSDEGSLHGYGGDRVIVCAVVFLVMCTAALVLRFLSHHVSRRAISLEDWVMIPAWLMMVGHCANSICGVKYGGVGRHEAYVRKYEPNTLTTWAQTLFIVEMIYGLLIPTVKTSILLLYLRLFGIRRWFRYTTYAMIAYIWAWGISEAIVAVAQCQPVAYQWDKSIDGTCLDQLKFYRWITVPNLAHDVVMLIAPAPVVWNLKIDWRQKLALSGIFVLGSFGCVASFIRTYRFWQLNAFSDRTWASIELVSWTIAEPGMIIICACLPALWPLVQRFVPGVGSSMNKSGNGTSRSARSTNLGQKTDGSGWNGHGRGMASAHDDFIPLNDVDDVMATYEVTGSPTENSERGSSGRGINVTTEVTVARST